jgi:CheY-specific phosphatase CheX
MVAMRFTGEMNGILKLAVPGELSLEIAANILGIDLEPDENNDRAKDAIREVLNVTCGHLMTEIAGDKPVFGLSVPTVEYLPQAQWDLMLQEPGTLGFMIEDQPAVLEFRVEDNT